MAKRWVQLFATKRRPPGGGCDFVVWGPSTGIYWPHYPANLQNLEIPISSLNVILAFEKKRLKTTEKMK